LATGFQYSNLEIGVHIPSFEMIKTLIDVCMQMPSTESDDEFI